MDEDVIIDAMERVYCLIPHLPGVVEYLAIPGVSACVTPVSHYTTNVVSRARLDKTGADATIQRVCDYYQSRNLSFGWVIDPHTTPADLATRLYHGGLTQGTGMDGMYLTDLRLSVDIAADVDIVEVPSDNPGTAVETFAVGFGAPLEVSRHFHRWISLAGKTLRTRVYLARIDGVRDPVACAYTTYFPDRPVALLGGAATLEDYRGRGIYTALLERRLADVRADGLEATIILADHSTSASICSHAGLTKACELGFHYWTADTI